MKKKNKCSQCKTLPTLITEEKPLGGLCIFHTYFPALFSSSQAKSVSRLHLLETSYRIMAMIPASIKIFCVTAQGLSRLLLCFRCVPLDLRPLPPCPLPPCPPLLLLGLRCVPLDLCPLLLPSYNLPSSPPLRLRVCPLLCLNIAFSRWSSFTVLDTKVTPFP